MQTGRTNDMLWQMYNRAVDGMEKHLLSTEGGNLFLQEVHALLLSIATIPSADNLLCATLR